MAPLPVATSSSPSLPPSELELQRSELIRRGSERRPRDWLGKPPPGRRKRREHPQNKESVPILLSPGQTVFYGPARRLIFRFQSKRGLGTVPAACSVGSSAREARPATLASLAAALTVGSPAGR